MGLRPWMTSDDLVESVKRKIAVPLNQRTFSAVDILSFANEEMLIAQVPDIMIYHQEYFVYSEDLTLVVGQLRYPIPERAMGQKLRDIFYKDTNGNLFEMTRISPDDKSYWERESGTTNLMQKYYLEGNDVVLAPLTLSQVTGSLHVSYFLRPNMLVPNDRAAIVQSFFTNVTLDNTTLVAGGTVNVGGLIFTAVSGSPSALQFQIGTTSAISAANLTTAINLDGTYSSTNSASSVTDVIYLSNGLVISSLSPGFSISSKFGMQFTDVLPTHFTPGMLVDVLQTRPGHKLLSKDVQLGINSLSTNSILFDSIPLTFEIGDYIAEQYECIIPQIPPDLHNGLAERTAARLLAAQGDAQGLQISQAKIAEIKHSEGVLLENRVDGSTEKVNQRKSCLSFQRMGIRRRI